MAALLSAVLPRTTNHPETAKAATSVPMVLAGTQHKAVVADSDALGPVMFNAPVLVREGAARQPAAALPIPSVPELPVIETLRTVPVFLGREPTGAAPPMSWTPSASQPLAPMPGTQPAPAAAPPPLDRDSLTTLVARPPATPPHEQVGAKPHSAEEPRPSARSPRISSPYERKLPAHTQQAKKRAPQASKKTVSQTRQAQWQSGRQGLRTATPPEEPSTMVKLLKSLNPFSSNERATKTNRSNLGAKTPDAPVPANSKDSFWWHERDASR